MHFWTYDEGLTLEASEFGSLHRRQITLRTLLITQNIRIFLSLAIFQSKGPFIFYEHGGGGLVGFG